MSYDPFVSSGKPQEYATESVELRTSTEFNEGLSRNPLNHDSNVSSFKQQQYEPQPLYLQPVFVQPAAYAPPQHAIDTRVQVPRPLPNRWADSICDWPKNLYPSCYCTCCFFQGMYLNAQIAEKTGYCSFNQIMLSYAVCWLFAIIGQALFGGGILLWLPMLYAFLSALLLRMHIVRRYQINECPQLGECCCGFWCWYCSVAQMARHVYGYGKILDGDGNPERPDNYGPIHQV